MHRTPAFISSYYFLAIIAAVILLNIFYFFIFAALVVLKQLKLYPSPMAKPISPEEQKSVAFAIIEKETKDIDSLGFGALCDLRLDTNPGTSALARFFLNNKGNIQCCASYITTKNIDNAFIEFTTEFEDGSCINTSNHAEPRIFIMENNELLQFPGASASVLHEIHKNRLDAVIGKKSPRKISEYSGEKFVADNNKLYNHQIERGILRREGDYLKLTPFGAFRSVFILQIFNLFGYNPGIHKIKPGKSYQLPKLIT